jgi:ribosomal protein L13
MSMAVEKCRGCCCLYGGVLPHGEAAAVSANLSVGMRAGNGCNQFFKNAVGRMLKENENATKRTKELLCYSRLKR